jgi:hypothetical protein
MVPPGWSVGVARRVGWRGRAAGGPASLHSASARGGQPDAVADDERRVVVPVALCHERVVASSAGHPPVDLSRAAL